MNMIKIKRRKPIPIRIDGDTAYVTLTGGKYTTIMDAEDVPLLDMWSVGVMPKKRYVTLLGSSSIKPRPHMLLARLVMNAPEGMCVDHINRNTLDNRKVNLRICTGSENGRNSKSKTGSTSRYKGVHVKARTKYSKIWIARIGHDGNQIYLGSFTKEEDAAIAYNKKAKELFGEYALLNVIR